MVTCELVLVRSHSGEKASCHGRHSATALGFVMRQRIQPRDYFMLPLFTTHFYLCRDHTGCLFVGPLPGPTMKCVCLVTSTTHPPSPRHLAQRLKAALPTLPRPQTHTFSESSCQQLFKNSNVTQIQRQ